MDKKGKRNADGGKPIEKSVRMDPGSRLCARYDATGIAAFPTADEGEMGVRVLDDFCEEHIM